jgi:hypothetical protein
LLDDGKLSKRIARKQAMQATKPDFDAKMKAITHTRRDAMAAAKAKRAAAKP